MNAVAERLSDLQAELSCQDKELDALYKVMKNHQNSIHQHLVDEAHQVRLVLDELGVALAAPFHQLPWGMMESVTLPTWGSQLGTLGAGGSVPADHKDVGGRQGENHTDGSCTTGEQGSEGNGPREMIGPECHLSVHYPQLGQCEPMGHMGPFR